MKTFNKKKVFLAKLLKPLWLIIGFVLKGKQAGKDTPRSILIMDVHLIGDLVTLTPLVAAIRNKYPLADISLLAGPWARDIFKNFDEINSYFFLEAPWVKYDQKLKRWMNVFKLMGVLRKFNWDMAIDVRGDVRHSLLLKLIGVKKLVSFSFVNGDALVDDIVPDSSDLINTIDYHKRICEHIGALNKNDPYIPFLKISEEERTSIPDSSGYIGLHFGGSLELKRPSLNILKVWMDHLIVMYPSEIFYNFYLSEDPLITEAITQYFDTRDMGHRLINWRGSLRDFIVVLANCKHLYCCDSAPSHIATALNINVTAIYGPTIAMQVGPKGSKLHVVEGEMLECRSVCDQRVCKNRIFRECMPLSWTD